MGLDFVSLLYIDNIIIVHILTVIMKSLILKPKCILYVLMLACYELMILFFYIFVKSFLVFFFGMDTYYIKTFL